MSILTDENNNAKIVMPGQFGTYSYKAQKYIRLNKAYVNLGYTKTVDGTTSTYWQYKYDTTSCDMVIIRCEIPEGASGYIMGFRGSSTSNEFSISIADGTITYKIGSKTTTHAWEAGVHNIGFTSDFYAYFDGKTGSKLTPSAGANGPRGIMPIGGWYKNGSYETVTSIDIYDAVISAFWVASQRGTAHFYAASGIDNTTACIFQTRIDSRSAAVAHQSGGSSSVGGDVTYGVQLHDLKFITSSGYRDLVAIMCEDWSEQASADADPAYTLTGPNGQSFSSAFLLKGLNPNASTGSISMPVPSEWKHEGETGGATPPSRPMTENYLGELIAGRMPKWKLWVDGINLGKRVKDVGGSYQFLYNIFMPPNGKQMPCLELFEGYSTAASANWPPVLQIPNSTLTIEFHNSLMCQCTSQQLIAEYASQSISTNEQNRIFRFANSNEVASIKFRLGNLPCWNMTPQEIYALEPQSVNLIYGMACTVEHSIYGVDSGAYSVIAMAYQQTTQDKGSLDPLISKQLMPLSSESNTATINMFKKGLTADGSEEANYGIYITGELETLLYRELVQGNVTARARLSAIRDSQTYAKTISGTTVFPTTAGLVFADHILGFVSASITGQFDTKMDGTATTQEAQRYRTLLMTENVTYNNTDYPIYPVATGYSNGVTFSTRIHKNYSSTAGDFTGDFFAFNFSLVNGSDMVSTSTTGFSGLVAVIEVTYKSSSSPVAFNKFVSVMAVTKQGDAKSSIPDPTASGEPFPQTYMQHPVTLQRYMTRNNDVPTYSFTAWKLINTNNPSGAHQTFPLESTTKVWIGHHSTMKPVWFTNSVYQYTSDQWKVDFGSTRGYILIDETKRELLGNAAWLEINFTSWNSSGNKSAFNVSSNRTINIVGYNGTVDSNGEPQSTNLTSITVSSGNTLSGLSCSATNSYQAEIVPGGKVPLGPDGQYPNEGIYGYRLRVLPPTGTTWKGVLGVTFQ